MRIGPHYGELKHDIPATEYHVIDFAFTSNDESKLMLVTEEMHERWCLYEPLEGYHRFETLGTFFLNEVPQETIDSLMKENNGIK